MHACTHSKGGKLLNYSEANQGSSDVKPSERTVPDSPGFGSILSLLQTTEVQLDASGMQNVLFMQCVEAPRAARACGEERTVFGLSLSSSSDQQDQQQSRPRRGVITRCPPGPTGRGTGRAG